MISSETQPECNKVAEDNSDIIIKVMKTGGYHRSGIARQRRVLRIKTGQ